MYITNFTPEQLVYERRWRIWIVLIVDAIELFACFRRPETLAQTLFVIGAVYVNLIYCSIMAMRLGNTSQIPGGSRLFGSES